MKELTCDTCQWHNRECYTSEPYEGKTGKMIGWDWCEFYQPKEETTSAGGSEE